MQNNWDNLNKVCDEALINSLPNGLKEAISQALTNGATTEEIVKVAQKSGAKELLVLAIGAFIDSLNKKG